VITCHRHEPATVAPIGRLAWPLAEQPRPPPPHPEQSSYMYKRKEQKIHSHFFVSQISYNMLSALLYERFKREQRDRRTRRSIGKMPSRELTDLILVLLHSVTGPRRRRHNHRGGRRHHRPVPTSTPPPPPPSATPCPWVLERPLSLSPN
jgi:hypothetical protein